MLRFDKGKEQDAIAPTFALETFLSSHYNQPESLQKAIWSFGAK
jgi:hypothetical protein